MDTNSSWTQLLLLLRQKQPHFQTQLSTQQGGEHFISRSFWMEFHFKGNICHFSFIEQLSITFRVLRGIDLYIYMFIYIYIYSLLANAFSCQEYPTLEITEVAIGMNAFLNDLDVCKPGVTHFLSVLVHVIFGVCA